jgi:hypothetical protein
MKFIWGEKAVCIVIFCMNRKQRIGDGVDMEGKSWSEFGEE